MNFPFYSPDGVLRDRSGEEYCDSDGNYHTTDEGWCDTSGRFHSYDDAAESAD